MATRGALPLTIEIHCDEGEIHNVAFDAIWVWPCRLLGLVPFGRLADASLGARSFSSIKTYSRVSFSYMNDSDI